ncbi:hypothetical protein [Luteibacter yeojuensis]|uniref:hypothetical protein n=1 Tax=Luteibacter yeojuensis TaxID=345309 RepID=UPI0012EDAFDF|nr:hypothetical protein [Luteibacter yeojuensis]
MNFDCFVIRYFPDSSLFFITATSRSGRSYGEIIQHYLEGSASKINFRVARLVLNGLNNQEFFNVGMRSTSPIRSAESYRISAGANTDRTISDSTGAKYAPGHFFGRAVNGAGRTELIGASGGGRVWSTGRNSIKSVVDWVSELHARITAKHVSIGKSGLDRLRLGEPLEQIPLDTVMADWGPDAYKTAPSVRWQDGDVSVASNILDCDIRSFQVEDDQSSLSFDIADENHRVSIRYDPSASPSYSIMGNSPLRLLVEANDHQFIGIDEWLDDVSLTYFTKNLATFADGTLHEVVPSISLNAESLRPRVWDGCDISTEFGPAKAEGLVSIQPFLKDILVASGPTFLIYDHRSGEAADFIVGRSVDEQLVVELHHCKGAGGKPGAGRVDDVYEVAGQAVKSARFFDKEFLLQHIKRRTLERRNGGHSPVLVSDRESIIRLIESTDPISFRLVVFAVQPGLSAASLDDESADSVRRIMAAANDWVGQDCEIYWTISD